MLALGAFMWLTTSEDLERRRLQQLNTWAGALTEGILLEASGWEDRVRLIASRTQMRILLQEPDLQDNPEVKARLRRILSDARTAVGTVDAVAVYDAEGELVASAGWGTETDLSERLAALPAPQDSVAYLGVRSPAHEELRVAYAAALTDDGTTSGQLVGVLHVRLNVKHLERLTLNGGGPGATGEALIAIGDTDGGVRVLTRTGPGADPSWEEVALGGDSDPVSRAMAGGEGPISEGLLDTEGKRVWAALRYIPELNLAVVVKMDMEEARNPVFTYRMTLTDVIISLAAMAILFGTILGFRFAKPIHDLANAASRIRDGDLSVRAPVTTQDEVGLLARNFNEMTEKLEQQVTLMKEFQNYFDYSRDMLCIAGHDGYFKRVNPAFERVLGWSTKELLSRSFLDFVHPDDLAKTEREIERLGQGLPTISFENRYMCQDGSEKRLAWTAHPEPEAGLIYAIARDVTDLVRERKEARDRIEYLQDRLEKAEAKLRGDP
jgi:PAS domain S-box-containing protein